MAIKRLSVQPLINCAIRMFVPLPLFHNKQSKCVLQLKHLTSVTYKVFQFLSFCYKTKIINQLKFIINLLNCTETRQSDEDNQQLCN